MHPLTILMMMSRRMVVDWRRFLMETMIDLQSSLLMAIAIPDL